MDMVRILLEVYGEPQRNDVLVYDEGKDAWVSTRKAEFLKSVRDEMREAAEEEAEYREGIEAKMEEIKSKLSKLNEQMNVLAKAIGGK